MWLGEAGLCSLLALYGLDSGLLCNPFAYFLVLFVNFVYTWCVVLCAFNIFAYLLIKKKIVRVHGLHPPLC